MNQAQPQTFAKLYDTQEYGQILVRLDQTNDGRPVIFASFNAGIEGLR